MSITVIDDHFVHYEVVGRGKPIIFIHGWLGTWRYWWPTMQMLSRNYRVFALNLWGFGSSSRRVESYSFDGYLDLLDQFVESLGISTNFALVGHTIGGAISLRYARFHSKRVDELVIVSLPIKGSAINHNLTNDRIDLYLERQAAKTAEYPELAQELNKIDPLAVANTAGQLAFYDFTTDLRSVSCPTLLLFGENDAVIKNPLESDLEFMASENHLFMVKLKDCDHFPMLQQPAIFNRLIIDFVDGENLENLAPKQYWQRRTH